jgi:hypothetical protein
VAPSEYHLFSQDPDRASGAACAAIAAVFCVPR